VTCFFLFLLNLKQGGRCISFFVSPFLRLPCSHALLLTITPSEEASIMAIRWVVFLLTAFEHIASVVGQKLNVKIEFNSVRRFAEQSSLNGNTNGNETKAPRIVGGTPVNDGDFPSFVFTAGSGLCGGTLIHPDIVLSAAHCAGEFFDGVLIGGTKIDGGSSTYIRVDEEVVHPDYDNSIENNDIMLIKLSSPSTAPIQSLNFDPK